MSDEDTQTLAGWIVAVPGDVIQEARGHRAPGAPPSSDGAALRKVDPGAGDALNDFQAGRKPQALSWAKRFAFRFAQQLQHAVCSGQDAKAIGLSGTGVATAVAAWLGGMFGLSNPIALGVAGLVVLALGRATIDAFCIMTGDELKALLQAV